MTAQLGFVDLVREKTPRLIGSGSKWDGSEPLPPAAKGLPWLRSPPREPGWYPVVARYDGGFWCGEVRHTSSGWRGWWASIPADEARALKRPLPAVPEW